MNYLLIAVNAAVFFAGTIAAMMGLDASFLYREGALYAPLILKGQGFYRILTAVFLHADTAHLFNNMIVQFAGGGIVERNLGHIQYGILYLACGAGGNIVSVLSDYLSGQYGTSVGASGAVFGIIGALLYIILRAAAANKRQKTAGDGSESGDSYRSLVIRAGLMAAYMLYSGWKNPLINQAAHVGGILVGFVLSIFMMSDRQSDLRELMS